MQTNRHLLSRCLLAAVTLVLPHLASAQPFTTGLAAGQVLGQANLTTVNTTPSQSVMRGPTCVAFSSTGKMAVADALGNRVLLWNSIPTSDGQPADVVIGQTTFTGTTGGTSATQVRTPIAVAFSPDGSKLLVADSNNIRVLVFNTIPVTNGAAADVVIGQPNFTSSTGTTTQTGLKAPSALLVTPAGKLLIADQTNQRVLIFNSIPVTNGAAADVVIGQTDFVSSTAGTTSSTFNNPEGLALAPDGRLLVADFANHRVLIFSGVPTSNGAAAVNVIGQTTLTSGAAAPPAANSLDGPWGLAVSPSGQLAISDINDNRVLIFNSVPTTNGASADVALGQPDLASDGVYNPGGTPSATNMNTADQSAFSADGRLWVPGRTMRRVMVFGTAAPPTDTGPTGGGLAADARAPTLSTTWAICTQGIYPTFGAGPLGGGTDFAYFGEIRCMGFETTNPSFTSMWTPCDGRLLSRTTYSNLFALIGTTFGAGDGSTTFAVPDLRGRIPVGQDGATLPMGTTGGTESVTLGVTNLPSHKHTITGGDTGLTGGGQAYNHQQPYLVLNFAMQNSGSFGSTMTWIRLFAFGNTPDGFFPCTGGTASTALYSALNALIFNTFGGDGFATFGIPDLRGRSPVGKGTGPSMTPRTIGVSGGSSTHTMTESEMPAHHHSLTSGNTGDTGGSAAIDQMDQFLPLTHGIANVGMFLFSDDSPALGEMRWYARSNVPAGYLQCDGASLSTSTEASLFSVLSNVFGGNGTSNFNAPDFRGRFVGGTGTGTGLGTYALGQYSGAESLVLSANELPSHTHSLVTAPEIDVEQPSGTHLVDGASNLVFGVENVGVTGAAKVFTITNTGSADLTGLNVTADGSNPGDFIITQPPVTTVAPLAYTTFTVAFAPTANLGRNAVLHIASNDADENTFDIGIAGVGNVAPTNITLTPSSVPEGNAGNLTVGTLAATDPDAFNTHTFYLVTGTGDADNGSFTISGSDLILVPVPDFETKSSYNIRVSATDQYGLSFEKALVVTVVNKNEQPSFVMGPSQRHPLGTSGAQTVNGWATAINDGDSTVTQTLTFLVSNDNNGMFTTQPAINATTGTLTYTLNGTSGTAVVSVQLQDDNSINGDAPNTTAMQTFTIIVDPLPDYQITLAAGALTITDLSGNSDSTSLIENTGEAGSVRFFAPGRTISVNGALNINSLTAPFVLSSLTSITINEGAGANTTSILSQIAASTMNFPSLTINGGASNDVVSLNNDIVFNPGASLDLNLQNDGGGGGEDTVFFSNSCDVSLSGAGAATIKCSKNILFNPGSTLTTVDGDLVLEANQQAVRTPGSFYGVYLQDNAQVKTTGTGQATVKGRGGDTGGAHGVLLSSGTAIQGGTTGTLTIVGEGSGTSPANVSSGVVTFTNTTTGMSITTLGANIVITGTAGNATGLGSAGVFNDGCLISAGGSGTVQVTGNGGTGLSSYGVYVWQFQGAANAQITSNGGNVTVIGNGGSSAAGVNHGVAIQSPGKITAGGNGSVSITGTCSTLVTSGSGIGVTSGTAISVPGTGNVTIDGTGAFGGSGGNAGVLLTASVSSQGGNISITGRGKGPGNTLNCNGVTIAGTTTTGAGAITIDGTAAANDTGYGVRCNASVTTAGGSVSITGIGGGGTGDHARGVLLSSNVTVSGPAAGSALTLNGTGGTSTGDYVMGVELFDNTKLLTSGGDISVTGVGGASSAMQFANGIMMALSPVSISAGGTGKITFNGTGGTSAATSTHGIAIFTGTISTNNGDIGMTGIAGGQTASPGSVGIVQGATVTAGGSGNVTFTADSMGLGAVSAVGDTINIRQRTAGTPVNLGTTDILAGTPTLGLFSSEVTSLACATLNIGNASTGPITATSLVSFGSTTGVVNITSAGAIDISVGQLSCPTGANVKLTAGGAGVIPTLPFYDVDTNLVGTLSFGSGTQLSIAINGNAFNSGYQVLDLRSRVDLTGVPLVLSGSYVPVPGDTFFIVRNESAFPTVGTFNGLPGGSLVTFNGVPLVLSYVGGTGNDVTLTPLQENVNVGGAYVANVPDFGFPTFVPGTLTATTVVSGAVSYGDLDAVLLTLPAGKTVTAASAVLTGVTGATGGATNSPGIIEFRDAGGTVLLSSTNFTADGTIASLNLPVSPITGGFRVAMVSPVSTSPTAGSATYVITLTIGNVTGGAAPAPVTSAIGDVVTGNAAPDAAGTGNVGTFDVLKRGGFLAENGNLVFPGTLLIGSGTPPVTLSPNTFMGLWKNTGSGSQLLARSGNDAIETGAPAAKWDVLPQTPAINDSGEVTFLASLVVSGTSSPATTVDNDTGLWSELGGTGLGLLIREGDPIPPVSPIQIGAFASGAYATAHTGATTGEAAFAVTMKNGSTDTAILRASINGASTAVGIVARQNTAMPGVAGESFGNLAGAYTDSMRMDATGNLCFVALSVSGRESIWYQPVTGGAPVKAFIAGTAATGDTAPGTGGATFKNIKSPSIGSAGTISFRGFLNNNGDNTLGKKGDGIWRGTTAGGFACILRAGDDNTARPGLGLPAGALVGNVWHSWLTNANHGAWKAWLDVNGNGTSSTADGDVNAIYTDLSGTMTLALKVGDAAPGIASATFSGFDLPVVGGTEQMAFLGTVTGGGTTSANNKGVWRSAANGGALTLVLRTGDTMSTTQGVKTISNVDFPGSGTTDRRWEQPVMDSTGRLLVLVTFIGGATTEVIVP
ncbi:MAG: tail fiber protein [Verrucomicrobiaceae bacterium]|nr:tail fiber protein [Verrucomicrobiaceae bacterium]